jgi:hypothetical protein
VIDVWEEDVVLAVFGFSAATAGMGASGDLTSGATGAAGVG